MTKTIILICDECLARNYKKKVNESRKERLILNKYCSSCRKKTLHKETR